MASEDQDQSHPTKDGTGDKKSKKKKKGISFFSFSAKDGAEKKPWYSFPSFLPSLQVRNELKKNIYSVLSI